MTRRALYLVMLGLSLICCSVGCSKTSEDDLEDASAAGDGDGDGDDNGDGDGDGDSSGDGDGDSTSDAGDGDGDGDTSGDGDGDGDGDVTPDDDGGMPTGEVCGAEICDEAACCADPFQSLCGAPIGARGCIMPPPEDTMSFDGCPGINAGGFFTIPSCCTEEGQCGIDAQQFGAGCIELGMFAMIVEQMGGGGMIMVPAPQACPE